jgi:hypothetical protein
MPPVAIFPEYSNVLAHWSENKVSGRTIICLDAHLDLQYINPERIGHLLNCTSPGHWESSSTWSG